MSDVHIKCPKCGAEVPLTESLAAPMVAAVRNEMQAKVDAAERDVANAKESAEIEMRRRVDAMRIEERDAAKREAAESVRLVNAEIGDLRIKLGEAQQAQAESLRKERDLESRERALELTVQTRINQSLTLEREQLRREFQADNRLKLLEKDTLLDGLQHKIDDLQQRITQGSQQLQGEVQELDLEAMLRARFPFDQVSEVAKGVNGADITQAVVASSGIGVGVILWESKRTKNWSQGWLAKLREDGRKAGADLLVIASQALPEGVQGFDQVEGVWVCSPPHAVPLAALLREALLRAHAVRQAQAGQATKAELVYQYLTGSPFRRRVEALSEAYTAMVEDLATEKKALTKAWAKREAQLEKVLTSTTGLFGDLQGIAGASIPEIEGMAMTALGAGK